MSIAQHAQIVELEKRLARLEEKLERADPALLKPIIGDVSRSLGDCMNRLLTLERKARG